MTYNNSKAKFLCSAILALTPISLAFAQEQTPQKAADTPSASPAAPKPSQKAIDPASLTVQDFARLPFVEQPQLSPDGKKLAGFMGMNGQQKIAMIDLFNTADKPAVFSVPDGMQVNRIKWVNDDNIVVSLSALQPLWGGAILYFPPDRSKPHNTKGD